MVYTSGIFHQQDFQGESLEVGQQRKIDHILDAIHLQKGERHLDIGCGGGTLAKEQVAFAKAAAKKQGVDKNTSWIIDDYRNIPKHNGGKKYDKITCVEMAEHVGIKN